MLASKAYTNDIPTFNFVFLFMISLLTAALVKVCDLGKPYFLKNVS